MRKGVRTPTIYRHSSREEWGYGIIVEENSDKVYVHFEGGGRRAFVNAPRYREQLVSVALPREDTAAVLAELGKFLPQPKKATRRKAPARKAEASGSHPDSSAVGLQ